MGKIILITEKPSVAQEYKKVLGINPKTKTDGYVEGYSDFLKSDVQITWAVGHLISLGSVDEQKEGKALPKTHKSSPWTIKNLPIFPKDWLYKVNYETKKQFDVVKKLYTQKDIDCIYYAGDSGREGIYIQALIRNQVFGGKNPKCDEKVVWIDSYTDASIKQGIKDAKPYTAYANMVEAGYQRAKTDWLIGMNFTQAYTLASRQGLIVTGRVMSPTLAMIVNRQKEIDNFKPENYYGFNAVVSETNIPKWKATKDSKYFESPLLFNENGFKKKEDADKLLKEFNADKHLIVNDIKVDKKTEYAPLLFNLADLQAHCSKTYHISPDKTLQVAQALYEKKYTTYPRTDARVLSSAVANDIKKKTGLAVPKKYVDDSKITDHYAIIPTGEGSGTLTDLEKKVYDDICTRCNAIFKPPYIYESITVSYKHQNGEPFYDNNKNVLQLGYRELYGEKEVHFETSLKKGDTVNVQDFNFNELVTKAPAAYTTGTLILAMEKAGKLIEDEELRDQIKTCGIGTSATRAGIIEKLGKQNYITVDKKQKITPTEVGKKVVDAIEKYDAKLLSPEKTAEMEQKLSDIAEGKIDADNYETYVHSYITDTMDTVFKGNEENLKKKTETVGERVMSDKPTKTYKCPKCSKELKYGRYGWYCECGFSFTVMNNGVEMTEKDLAQLIKTGKTDTYEFTWKSGKKSKAHLVLDKTNKYGTKFEFD